MFLIGRVKGEAFSVVIGGIVAEGGFDAQGMFGRVCERGLRTVDTADGEIFLVEVDLNGELACMLVGVLRFLKILEWP